MSNSSAIASIAGVIDATNLPPSRPENDGVAGRERLLSCFWANALQILTLPHEACPGQADQLRPELIPTSSNRLSSEPVSNSTIPLLLNCCLLKSKPAITPLTHTRAY